jgi:hypothetical protein
VLPSPQPRERRGDVDEARAPACRVGQERSPRRDDDDDALAAACAGCLEPPPGLRDGLDALERGAVARGVDLLAGRGDGLTPAGDDVLAGYAAWEWPAGGASGLARLAAGRASPIGLAYLRCAERGELPEPAAATLAAIRAGDVAAAARHGRTLSRWGSSSGAALLWGMAAGRRAEFRPRRPALPG